MVSFPITTNKLFHFFYNIRVVILLFWLVVTFVCLFFARDFVSATSIVFDPPKSSAAYEANELYRKAYPNKAQRGMIVVLLRLNDNNNNNSKHEVGFVDKEVDKFAKLKRLKDGENIEKVDNNTVGSEKVVLATNYNSTVENVTNVSVSENEQQKESATLSILNEWTCRTTQTLYKALTSYSAVNGGTDVLDEIAAFFLAVHKDDPLDPCLCSAYNTTKISNIGDFTNKTISFSSSSTSEIYSESDSIGNGNTTFIDSIENKLSLLALKRLFVSTNDKSSLIYIFTKEVGTTNVFKFIDYLRTVIEKLDTDGDKFSIELTGYDVVLGDIQEGTVNDLKFMEFVSLPFALVVLFFVLRSPFLMIIPLFSVAISVVVSFAVMYPIALAWDVANFSPSIMMSCVLAMSIDYSLFLLTRFKEQVEHGDDCYRAVYNMLRHAGHIVLTSGSILIITFSGIAFFPLALLASMGVSAAISLVITVLVNLTLTPALILTFPSVFMRISICACCECCGCCKHRTEQLKQRMAASVKESTDHDSIWVKITRLTTAKKLYSVIVIVIIIIIIVPFSISLFVFSSWSMDNTQVIPPSSAGLAAERTFALDWPEGMTSPYELIAVAKQDTNPKNNITQTILTWDYYHRMHRLIRSINKYVPGLDHENIISITNMGTMPIPFPAAKALVQMNEKVFNAFYDHLTNSDHTATRVLLPTAFNPALNITEMVLGMRKQIERSDFPSHDVALRGTMVDQYDAVNISMGMLPLMVIITFSVVILILVFVFRSPFLSVRAACTVSLTLLWVYGTASLVFCASLLDGIFPSLAASKGFYWAVPVMTFSILVGLGMDYDVFLFSRIAEFRNLGFSTKAAILKGVAKTGHIITYAGIIMGIAFSGLLFSNLLLLQQFGFILTFAILMDTFVIRTLLNPAIINLSGELTWWPRKLPILFTDYTLDISGEDDEDDEGFFIGKNTVVVASETTTLINNSSIQTNY